MGCALTNGKDAPHRIKFSGFVAYLRAVERLAGLLGLFFATDADAFGRLDADTLGRLDADALGRLEAAALGRRLAAALGRLLLADC